jgi:hypothetical protein
MFANLLVLVRFSIISSVSSNRNQPRHSLLFFFLFYFYPVPMAKTPKTKNPANAPATPASAPAANGKAKGGNETNPRPATVAATAQPKGLSSAKSPVATPVAVSKAAPSLVGGTPGSGKKRKLAEDDVKEEAAVAAVADGCAKKSKKAKTEAVESRATANTTAQPAVSKKEQKQSNLLPQPTQPSSTPSANGEAKEGKSKRKIKAQAAAAAGVNGQSAKAVAPAAAKGSKPIDTELDLLFSQSAVRLRTNDSSMDLVYWIFWFAGARGRSCRLTSSPCSRAWI